MIRLFNVAVAPATFILMLFESLFWLGAFVLATLAVGDLDPVDYLIYDSGAVSLLLVLLSFLLGMHFQDLYTQIGVKSRVLVLQQLCVAAGVAFLVEALISYLDSDLSISVPVMLLGSAIGVTVIYLGRLTFGPFLGRMIPRTQLVMIGRSPILGQLRKWIEDHPDAALAECGSAETLAEMKELDEVLNKQQLPRLVVGLWAGPDSKLTDKLTELVLAGYEVEGAAAAYERVCNKISLYSVGPQQVVYSTTFDITPQKSLFRLVMNGLVAALCFVVTIPALVLTAMVLRAMNHGPVWRRDSLVGAEGRMFQAYRFRVAGNSVPERVIRRFWLDRLPQFLNVLKGELAIIGPRAQRPEYYQAIERHIPFYRQRYSVRPGMTGWAQVHLDNSPQLEDTMAMLEYDLYYIKHMSLGLDTLVLLHTLKSMLMLPPATARVWTGEQLSASSR